MQASHVIIVPLDRTLIGHHRVRHSFKRDFGQKESGKGVQRRHNPVAVFPLLESQGHYSSGVAHTYRLCLQSTSNFVHYTSLVVTDTEKAEKGKWSGDDMHPI